MMETSSAQAHKNSRSVMESLEYAVLEWLLILMLFIDAVFSFLITTCARYWKLTPPCLLCSRLDHVFSCRKKGYYWNMICNDHKSEISSAIHDKCENCLFSSTYSIPNIECKELKIKSDAKSECLDSINEGVKNMEPHVISPKYDLVSDKVITELASTTELEPEPLDLVSRVGLNDALPHGNVSVESNASTGFHGLEELNWKQEERKPDHDIAQSDLTSSLQDNIPPPSNSSQPSIGILEQSRASKGSEGLEAKSVSSDSGQLVPNLLDLGDAYKLAVSNGGRQSSSLLSEQFVRKNSSRLSEDLKLLLTQLSFSQVIEQSIPNLSPRLSINSDEFKPSDSFNTSGTFHKLQKRISLERKDSGLESLDGSFFSEIEGESMEERLKRQVEHDRKIMSCLYKELEEERNASGIAVNQAMAMITKLQEEKATLHMEALQCLRMMEERAEYDNEALQKANDLLVEKEKEVQDLVEKLEILRKKYVEESCDMKARDIGAVHFEKSEGDHENVKYGVKSSLLEVEEIGEYERISPT